MMGEMEDYLQRSFNQENTRQSFLEKIAFGFSILFWTLPVARELYRAMTKKDETQIQYINKQPYLKPERDRIII